MIHNVCGYHMCFHLPEPSLFRQTWKQMVRLREMWQLKILRFVADLEGSLCMSSQIQMGELGAWWGVCEPSPGHCPTHAALPGSQVSSWSGTNFQWRLLQVPKEGLGHHSTETDQGVFSFHLPFPVLPSLCYLYNKQANSKQENILFFQLVYQSF